MSTNSVRERDQSDHDPAERGLRRIDTDPRVLLVRLASCLFGGVVLAIMVGTQEGSLTNFGISFQQAVLGPRIVIFLALGVLVFLAITFWALVAPYVTRPGVYPLASGLLIIVVAQTIMNWYDPLAKSNGSGKFRSVATAVSDTGSISSLTVWFFNWLGWVLAAVALILCAIAIVTRTAIFGYLTAVIGIAAAVIAFVAHSDVVDIGGGIDHSLGAYADLIGFALVAFAGVAAVRSHVRVADPRGFALRVMTFRPGLPFAVVGVIFGLLALTTDCWFGPLTLNASFAKSGDDFTGTGLDPIASQYLSWLAWALFAVAALLALATIVRVDRILGWATALVSVVSIVLTFVTLRSMTAIGARVSPQNGANWQNLGVGGFVMCVVFALFAAAALPAITGRRTDRASQRATNRPWTEALPISSMVDGMRRSSVARPLIIVGIALALFYPPMLTVTWQNVLVGQIGVYVLLALGLNVVIGWAGLLDLGYIAFYAIGAYVTAYLVGALPVKPPSWLQMTPLLTIPFAIIACLIAGVLLGAPTLRLRGDYLAIVTLAFGELIQIIAINNPGNLTGGPSGPTIPHPRIHIGGFHITWGQDDLPYWYLLLVMLVIVIVLFYRLEGSRIGRAWAAIREDEVAAQATGINTVRLKLLAFAIGASTSALAGTFFATQVGYIDPSLFTLQASILIVAYVVFGGMGSIAGAMAGAAALTWLPQFLKDQVPQADRQMWVGALVLAMMIFRPAGLLPARRRKAELTGLAGTHSAEVGAVPPSEGL
jgi:ABC-type branched-subunit amino acid transport system permease subunit